MDVAAEITELQENLDEGVAAVLISPVIFEALIPLQDRPHPLRHQEFLWFKGHLIIKHPTTTFYTLIYKR